MHTGVFLLLQAFEKYHFLAAQLANSFNCYSVLEIFMLYVLKIEYIRNKGP